MILEEERDCYKIEHVAGKHPLKNGNTTIFIDCLEYDLISSGTQSTYVHENDSFESVVFLNGLTYLRLLEGTLFSLPQECYFHLISFIH